MLHSNLAHTSEVTRPSMHPCALRGDYKTGVVPSSGQLQKAGTAVSENIGLPSTRGKATARTSKQASHVGGSDNDDSSTKIWEANHPVSYSIGGSPFMMDSRYRDLKPIGKGSYGTVCCARDTLGGGKVAIKKIQSMSKHAVNAKHVLREIRLMRYLSGHPNMLTLQNIYVDGCNDELYLVMDLMDSDLHKIIQSPQPLSDSHFRYFMYQLFQGVRFLHENRIIHRDLKPGNLLVTKNCTLKITDFGLARVRPVGRGVNPDDTVDDPMTEHVVTRWYRPPELMLCPNGLYEYSVDLWSCGCILAEMLGRSPLFPGRNFVDQLTLIFDVLGSPAPIEVEYIRNPSALKFLHSIRGKQRKCFLNLFESASPLAVDLLEGLLVFDPPDRLTVHESISHRYFEPLWENDTVDIQVVQELNFNFESQPLQLQYLKGLILDEIDSFHEDQSELEQESPSHHHSSSGPSSMSNAGAATAKSCHARRATWNNSNNSYISNCGGGKGGETVQKPSSQMLAQKEKQSGASAISTQKTANSGVFSRKYTRANSQGNPRGDTPSSVYSGSRASENSDSLSASVPHRPTSNDSNRGNEHELSDRMHKLKMKHERKNSGTVSHMLEDSDGVGSAGTIHSHRKPKSDSDYVVGSSSGDLSGSGDSTMRPPTSTLPSSMYRAIAGKSSPLMKCSSQDFMQSCAANTHTPISPSPSYTSVGKPPNKQRRT